MFLSSGDDARDLRDLVDNLVREAVNAELDAAGVPVRLIIRRWERTAPGKAVDEDVNARFVRMATESSIAICLLLKKLGNGTKEEIEAVLKAAAVELSIVWFVDQTSAWPKTKLGKFLGEHRGELYIDRAGPPDSPGASIALVRLLLRVVLERLRHQDEEVYRERR